MATQFRTEFHTQLKRLGADVANMGLLTAEQVQKATSALLDGDTESAGEVIADDSKLDQMESEFELRCVQLLATQNPVASDLRYISSIFKITGDFERIGDHAVKIAYIAKDLKALGHPGDLPELRQFANATVQLIRDTVYAFDHLDVDKAHELVGRDKAINAFDRRLAQSIVDKMQTDPQDIDYYSLLLFVPGRLERIADHCTNIAERIAFVVTGKLELHHEKEKKA